MNKLKKFFKSKYVLPVCGVCALALAAAGAGIFFHFRQINELKQEKDQEISQLQEQLNANYKSGYVATTDIKKGDILTEGENVVFSSSIISNLNTALFETSDCIGMEAMVSIPAGSPILINRVTESLTEQWTERECTFIHLNVNLTAGDYVDVRVLFPNGEDYIVAAKKCVKNPIVPANLVYLWLTEDEIESLDAAIVDANLHNAKIYTAKYIKPEIQPANIVTYQPNVSVIQLMQNDPNIVAASARALSASARNDLEDRIAAFEEAYPSFEFDDQINDDLSNSIAENAAGAVQGTQPGANGAVQGTQPGTDGTAQQDTSQSGTQDVTYGE